METSVHALVVDDDRSVAFLLSEVLAGLGHRVNTAQTGEDAVQAAEADDYDLVVLDLVLPDTHGLNLLETFQDIIPNAKVIILTGHADVETAVRAMKLGAFDYLTKPLNTDEFVMVVQKALEHNRLVRESMEYRKLKQKSFHGIVGVSSALKRVYALIEKVAPSDANVLVVGEDGTGKSLVVRAIHDLSGRKQGPFVKLDCDSLPPDLMESELFGYEKGAFTGAYKRKRGVYELADSGTLMLDEVFALPGHIQVRLLHAIEEKTFLAVGGETPKSSDARVVSTSRKNAQALVVSGFREDLLLRLSTFQIVVPPLRERKEDIPVLVRHFLDVKEHRELRISDRALSVMAEHEWPGNVRELEQALDYAQVACEQELIDEQHLPAAVRQMQGGAKGEMKSLQDVEREHIARVLETVGGHQGKAADLLGISRKGLWEKRKRYGLDKS